MNTIRYIGILSLLLYLGSGSLWAGGAQQFMRMDTTGIYQEVIVSEGEYPSELKRTQKAGILWHVNDPGSIVYSICSADLNDETWIGHDLNYERLSYLQTTGSGIPVWEFDVAPENPNTVAVGSAEDVSLGLLLVSKGGSNGVSIRAFTSSGPTPVWTYDFPTNYTSTTYANIDCSCNGLTVAAAAYDSSTTTSLVVILNGITGGEIENTTFPVFIRAVELSYDGSRAILTESVARIVETGSLTTLHTFSASGGGNVLYRLSGNGKVAAAGGFNFVVHRETGGVWSLDYQGQEASQWYGQGLALSEDGNTFFVSSYTYTNYLTITYRLIDLVSETEIARTTTTGSGSKQDTIARAEASADGQVFAIASWGTEDNAHPEVQIFDRGLNLIGSIDTPGSPFSLDLTRDGRYCVAGGKNVHANDMGSGSDSYAYETPYQPVPTLNHWCLCVLSLLCALLITICSRSVVLSSK